MYARTRAVEAYLKALRTGEASAAMTAARYLAPDVVLDTVGAHMWGNGHLANNTPLIVAYTDEKGAPNLSLRGSTQVYSDTQLSIWVRHANGGMANALKKNPHMMLMYRDPPARTTLTFEGRAHFEADPRVRERVFDLAPEVEQKHDPGHIGAALIIDIDRVTGNTPRGAVRMQAAAPTPA